MKQQQLVGYRPNYPRKALRGAALTAAALVAMGGMTGCRKAKLPELQTEGMVPMETPAEELILDGAVAVADPTPTPGVAVTLAPEVLVLDGEVAIPEPNEEVLVLDGEERIEPLDEARIGALTTTGMVYVPEADARP